MTRQVLIGAIAIVALLAGVGLCAQDSAVVVDAVRAREQALEIVVATNGKVEPIAKAQVRARLDGRIVAIPDPGVRVDADEVILRIDGGPVDSELAAARSQRLAALDSLRAARDKFSRVAKVAATDQMLFEKKALARERYEESQAELREARARVSHLETEVPLRVEALDHEIAEWEARRRASEVRAPFAGTVYRTDAKRGQTVQLGDPVLHFADLQRLRVRANVDQVDLGRVEVGQSVRIASNAYPGRTWEARMAEMVPNVVLKESRRVAEGLAEVSPPSEGLVPGMTVDVEILVDASPGALQVPAEAVFSDPAGSFFVYRVDGGRIRQARVRLGRSTVATVEVVEGLSEEDPVVLGPLVDLKDGDEVDARLRDDG